MKYKVSFKSFRERPILSNYRPNWTSTNKPEQNCAQLTFTEKEKIEPGEECECILDPIAPSLWLGIKKYDELKCMEGLKQVGEAIVIDLIISTFVVHSKKSKYDVYIGRPSKWGNPFSHLDNTIAKFKVSSREESIIKYEEWLWSQPELIVMAKKELKGKVLGCWCFPLPCHGDILARIANV